MKEVLSQGADEGASCSSSTVSSRPTAPTVPIEIDESSPGDVPAELEQVMECEHQVPIIFS